MAVKKTDRGKILLNHEGFSINQVPKYEGYGKERRMVSSTIAIYKVKHLIQDGFKNPKEAVIYIDDNFEFYNKKAKKFNIPKPKEE